MSDRSDQPDPRPPSADTPPPAFVFEVGKAVHPAPEPAAFGAAVPPAESAPESQAKPARTVTLQLGNRACELRTLTSADRDSEANVYLQEIILHTDWMERVRRRFWVDSPTRKERVDLALYECLAALLSARITPQAAESAAAGIRAAIDRALPGGAADMPEVPNAIVFERLARVAECRRQALTKLLRELLVRAEDRDQAGLDAIVNTVRDDATLTRILDAILG